MLRWRGRINVWESLLYVFSASLGVGMLNSSQFIGLAASIEKPQLATAVSLFYLSQQMGLMIGASGSAALLRTSFRNALVKNLGHSADGKQVSLLKSPSILSRQSLLRTKKTTCSTGTSKWWTLTSLSLRTNRSSKAF